MLDINLLPPKYQKKSANGYNPTFAPIVFTGVVLFCLSSYSVNSLKMDYINNTSKDLKTKSESITSQVSLVESSETQTRTIQNKFNNAISKWGNPNALYPKMDMISSSMGNDIWIDKLQFSDQAISTEQQSGQTTATGQTTTTGQTTATGQTTTAGQTSTTGQTTAGQTANNQTATKTATSQTATKTTNSQTTTTQATTQAVSNNFLLHGYSFSYKSIAELMKNMKTESGLDAKIVSMEEKKFEDKVEYIEFQLSFAPKGAAVSSNSSSTSTQGSQTQTTQPSTTTQSTQTTTKTSGTTDANLPSSNTTAAGGK